MSGPPPNFSRSRGRGGRRGYLGIGARPHTEPNARGEDFQRTDELTPSRSPLFNAATNQQFVLPIIEPPNWANARGARRGTRFGPSRPPRAGAFMRGGSRYSAENAFSERPARGSRADFSQRGSFSGRGRQETQANIPADELHADTMIRQLASNDYTCVICLQSVRFRDHISSCPSCHTVFHARCLSEWVFGTSGTCPACRFALRGNCATFNSCFCGSVKGLVNFRGCFPHSCGRPCPNARKESCKHACQRKCHPGKCDPCKANISITCGCGSVSQIVECPGPANFFCKPKCDNVLSCGKHKCTFPGCHKVCPQCPEKAECVCNCGCVTVFRKCGEVDLSLNCGFQCDHKYDCGIHQCQKICHNTATEPCGPCPFSPAVWKTCGCKKRLLTAEEMKARTTCSDPVPSCESLCSNSHPCCYKLEFSSKKPAFAQQIVHECLRVCHDPWSNDCGRRRVASCCQCYSTELYLGVSPSDGNSYTVRRTCQVPCQKKYRCGHGCNQVCCTIRHPAFCAEICGKTLSCNKHTCNHTCHFGIACDDHLIYEFTTCACGRTTFNPPIKCQDRVCTFGCYRVRSCGHIGGHPCHEDGDPCPPCVHLTSKMCEGGHCMRSNVICSQPTYCANHCQKPLACGHLCERGCHKGVCMTSATCSQKCGKLLPCGHSCQQTCHIGDCSPLCKIFTSVSCFCGFVSKPVPCPVFQALTAAKIAKTESDLKAEQHPESSTKNAETDSRPTKLRRSASVEELQLLECTGECAVNERNLQFARALKISVDDKGNQVNYTPMLFTPALLQAARTNIDVVKKIEENFLHFLNIVSWDPNRKEFHFKPMPRHQRLLCHQYAPFFGCTSISVDMEPQRSVVVYPSGTTSRPVLLVSDLVTRFKQNPTLEKIERTIDFMRASKCMPSNSSQPANTKPARKKRQVKKVELHSPTPVTLKNPFALLDNSDEST